MATQQRSFVVSRTAPAPPPTPTLMAGTPSLIVLSDPIVVDLAVYRGDSGGFRISVKDPDDAPIDVLGATWDSDIRLVAPAPEVLTNFEIVPVAGDNSSVDVILPAENSELLTGNCVYDIEMTLLGQVTTLIKGAITVTQDVSRT